MSVETSLYSTLTGNSGVSALIATRLYPLVLPQKPTLPAATYQRISTRPVSTRSGNGLDFVRMQIDCYGATYANAKALAAAVVAALTNTGQLQQMMDGFDDTPEIYRVSVDFLIGGTDG